MFEYSCHVMLYAVAVRLTWQDVFNKSDIDKNVISPGKTTFTLKQMS